MNVISDPVSGRTLEVKVLRVTAILFAGVVLIALANVLAGFVQLFTGRQVPLIIDVAKEQNIPTWYNATLLAFSGALTTIVARVESEAGGAHQLHWWGLAVTMTYMSMDELVAIHERVELYLEPSMIEPISWIYNHRWVIVGLPIVILFVIAYLPFLRDLPSRTRRWLVLAGAVYVTGALGMETMHSLVFASLGGGVCTSLATLAEEGMEMLGVVIFIHGLLSHLTGRAGGFDLRIQT